MVRAHTTGPTQGQDLKTAQSLRRRRAVREVEEETGQIITLGAPLDNLKAITPGQRADQGSPLPGILATPLSACGLLVARTPRTEIDQTTWAPPERAADMPHASR